MNNIDNNNNGLYNFFNWLLRRKILVSVINLFLITAGILSYFWLEWKEEPTANKSVITISTMGKFGSHIDMFENEVTKKVENVIANVSGIDYFTSTTKNGDSNVTVYFKDNIDPQESLNRIRTAVGSVATSLPSYANHPTISTGNSDDKGILDILFYPSENNLNNEKKAGKEKVFAMKKYIEEDLKPRILKVDGVANVKISGVEESKIYIHLDLNKIHRLKLNIVDIKHTISKALRFTQSDEFGSIKTYSKKINITSVGNTYSLDDLKQIIIAPGIPLKDIAEVKIKQNIPDVYFNGSNPSLHVMIFKTATGNPINTIDEVSKIVKDQIAQRKDINISFLTHLKKTKELFKKVKTTGLEAILLVLLIVLLFTFSLSGSLVPAIAVPVSIMGTFTVMGVLNLSFNPATLAALVLSIGLVVDDAIVILENIHKKIIHGQNPLMAAIEATTELCLPIILMTLTLAFVFLPTLFGEGPTKYELKEFAIVISSAVIFSGINSLTLSPVLSYLLMANKGENRYHKKFIDGIEGIYQWFLKKAFQWKKSLLIIVGGFFILMVKESRKIPSETKPYILTEDAYLTGRILRQENSVNKKFFLPYIKIVAEILNKYRGKYYKFFYININNGSLTIRMMFYKKYVRQKQKIINDILDELSMAVPGINFNISSDSLEKKVSFYLVGEKTPEEFSVISNKFQQILKEEKLIKSVWFENKKSDSYNFALNFNKIQELHLDPSRVKEMIPILFHDMSLGDTSFVKSPKNYPTWIGVNKKFQYSPDEILFMTLAFPDARDQRKITYVALKDLITITNVESLTNKRRFMAYPSSHYTYELYSNITVGIIVDRMKELEYLLPFGVRIEFVEESRDYINSKGNLLKMIIFAILCIFFILAAQFESLKDAILILMTAPLAFMGAVAVMLLLNLTFNVYTIIGLITLIGLITKHGILFVSTANQLLSEGMELKEAIIQGATSRFAAVLMTTLAMILGCIPLAISYSTAVAPLKQMCLILIGGLALGTIQTILVIPILYYFFKNK